MTQWRNTANKYLSIIISIVNPNVLSLFFLIFERNNSIDGYFTTKVHPESISPDFWEN